MNKVNPSSQNNLESARIDDLYKLDLLLDGLFKKHPKLTLTIKDKKTKQTYQLQINFNGDLVYRDGHALRLVQPRKLDFVLTNEALDKIEQLQQAENTNCTEPATTKGNTVIGDTRALVYGLNCFIDARTSGAEKKSIEAAATLLSRQAETQEIPAAYTKFFVIVRPDDTPEKLVIKYVLAICNSLNDLRHDLEKNSIMAKQLVTRGLVRKTGDLLARFKIELKKLGFQYKQASTQTAYSEFEISISGSSEIENI